MKYPKIDIQISTSVTSELLSRLRTGLLDIVILNLPTNDDKDIEIIKCQKIHDCFVVNDTYKELLKKKLSLEELNNYPIILQAKGANTRTFLDDFTKKQNTILKPNMELASHTLVSIFTKIGMGIGYMTKEYIESELKNEELFILNVKPKIPSRYVGIALSKNHLSSFSTKKLIEIITKDINI